MLFCVVFLAYVNGQNTCCSDIAANLTENEECDGLNCTRGNVYLLDPTSISDDFFYVDNETRLIFNNGTSELPPSRYCLGFANIENVSVHEIALICVENEPAEPTPKWFIVIVIIFRTLEYTSVVFLVFTVVIYVTLSEIRNLQGHCTIHFLVNYSVTYFIVNVLFDEDYSLAFSFTKSHVLYFFTLSSFCWLNIVTLNLWKRIRVWQTTYIKTYFIYVLSGYGIPVLLFCTLIIRHHSSDTRIPDFQKILQERGMKWRYFYIPIIANLSCIALAFADSRRRLRKMYISPANGTGILPTSPSKYRFSYQLYLKLSLVIGVTWLLEIVFNEFFKHIAIVFVITDILNSMQGILIFLILIVMRRRVLKILAKRKPCGFDCFPTTWNAIRDEETDDADFIRCTEPFEEQFSNNDARLVNVTLQNSTN